MFITLFNYKSLKTSINISIGNRINNYDSIFYLKHIINSDLIRKLFLFILNHKKKLNALIINVSYF